MDPPELIEPLGSVEEKPKLNARVIHTSTSAIYVLNLYVYIYLQHLPASWAEPCTSLKVNRNIRILWQPGTRYMMGREPLASVRLLEMPCKLSRPWSSVIYGMMRACPKLYSTLGELSSSVFRSNGARTFLNHSEGKLC